MRPEARHLGMRPPPRLRLGQSRRGSFIEAAANVLLGYLLALLTQAIVYPLFGIETAFTDEAAIAAIFTVVSLLRSYVVRRTFERLALPESRALAVGEDN